MLSDWTRTVLPWVAFTWVVFAWHRHEAPDRRERARVEELIASYCAISVDYGDKERKATDREREQCEIDLRVALGGRTVRVSGSVDVSGNVGVSQP